MKNKTVKDLMIPIENYASVNHRASILEAMITLRKSQENVPKNLQPFRAVLVIDDNNKIIGKIGHLAFLKALEPKYRKLNDLERLAQANLSEDFINTMMENFNLWTGDFYDLCSRVNSVQVKDIMKQVDERIDENATIVEAMHKIIMWQTLSILVNRGDEVVGIIRLSDIYNELESYIINECQFNK
jgi:CBS domain-containing protein